MGSMSARAGFESFARFVMAPSADHHDQRSIIGDTKDTGLHSVVTGMSDYEALKGGLRLKKGGKIVKKKKKESIDLRKIDLTIQREGDSKVAQKTAAELAFEERQKQNQLDRLKKKAAISHREKVEKFNSQMGELTEFNDIPKVSWTK